MKQNPCRYCALSVEYKGKHNQGFCKECYECENLKKHKKYLLSQRKYKVGEPITNLEELLEQEFVMWNDSIRHIEFIKSLQFRLILKALENKRFCKAIKKESEE